MRFGGAKVRSFLAAALALGPVSCRFDVIPVDTSRAKFIPTEVAVANLRDLLPTAEMVFCGVPPSARYRREEIREWRVDAREFEFRAADKASFRFAFADISFMRLQWYGRFYQVRLFSEAQRASGTENFHFGWREEDPARRAMELFEALRQKQ